MSARRSSHGHHLSDQIKRRRVVRAPSSLKVFAHAPTRLPRLPMFLMTDIVRHKEHRREQGSHTSTRHRQVDASNNSSLAFAECTTADCYRAVSLAAKRRVYRDGANAAWQRRKQVGLPNCGFVAVIAPSGRIATPCRKIALRWPGFDGPRYDDDLDGTREST